MSLKKYIAIAKSPKTALHYARKYGKNYASSGRYSVRRFLHVNEYRSLGRRINKSIPSFDQCNINVFVRKSSEEIASLLKEADLSRVVFSQAEKGLNNEFLVLNKTRKDMFDSVSGHYRWHEDFFEGYTYKMSYFSRARIVNARKGVDIKIPWETSRMQYLFSLAMAYQASRDEKYAIKIRHIITDFMECNDYDEGPNWNVSMEVGIRIANIVLAVELIRKSTSFDEDFYRRFVLCVYAHRKHIFNNLENVGGKTSNHFLGDLLGLATAVAACPFLPDSEKVREYVIDSLHHEISHQVQSDGSDFEGSTSYQRLVGELLCFTILAAEQIGFELSDDEKNRLTKMAEFEQSIRMHNGLVPQVGDNDSGRVFQLSEEETRDHTSCINLLLSLGKQSVLKHTIPDGFSCFWRSGLSKDEKLSAGELIESYDDFGALRFKGDHFYLFFTAGTPERKGMPGHTHNDLLSFLLSCNEEFITDPGSGEYTGHPEIRNELRSTRSHSTVQVDDIEQRLMVSDSLFQWYSKNNAKLEMRETLDSYVFSGRYSQEKAGYAHARTIVISKDERQVRIEDDVEAQAEEFTMRIPIHPAVSVDMNNGIVYLRGESSTLRVSGTWRLSLDEGFYSSQYHDTEKTKYVLCESNEHINSLLIERVIKD